MNTADTTSEIIKFFKTAWGTRTPIAFDNVPSNNTNTSVSWVRLSVNLGRTFEEEKGDDGVGRRIGTIVVQIYTPLTKGTKAGLDLADAVELIFRRKDFNGVYCDEPYTVTVTDADNFYQHNTIVPFWTWVGE